MENSYKFFENKDCEYFPCHKGVGDFNCMFCYCPMYNIANCAGNPNYIDTAKGTIKDCSNCTFPHIPDNYDKVIAVLRERLKKE